MCLFDSNLIPTEILATIAYHRCLYAISICRPFSSSYIQIITQIHQIYSEYVTQEPIFLGGGESVQ